MMEIPISLPLDSDSFLRRECPQCEQEFKWHHGRTEETPEDFVDPPLYFCPRCGENADPNDFLTQAQVAYVEQVAAGPLLEDLARTFEGGPLDFKVTGESGVPDPLVEPDDMTAIQSPCHPWEPIKVPDDANPLHYCLVCGAAFSA